MDPLNLGFLETSVTGNADYGDIWAYTDLTAIFTQYDPVEAVQMPEAANDDWYENLYPPIA